MQGTKLVTGNMLPVPSREKGRGMSCTLSNVFKKTSDYLHPWVYKHNALSCILNTYDARAMSVASIMRKTIFSLVKFYS